MAPHASAAVLPVQDVLWWTLSRLEPWIQGSRLRRAALEEVMRLVHYEVRAFKDRKSSAVHCATLERPVNTDQLQRATSIVNRVSALRQGAAPGAVRRRPMSRTQSCFVICV